MYAYISVPMKYNEATMMQSRHHVQPHHATTSTCIPVSYCQSSNHTTKQHYSIHSSNAYCNGRSASAEIQADRLAGESATASCRAIASNPGHRDKYESTMLQRNLGCTN